MGGMGRPAGGGLARVLIDGARAGYHVARREPRPPYIAEPPSGTETGRYMLTHVRHGDPTLYVVRRRGRTLVRLRVYPIREV